METVFCFQITFFIIYLGFVCQPSHQISELGCYTDDRLARAYTVPASDYSPAGLNVAECRYKCECTGHSFAALQQGNLCLCAAEQNLNVAGTCDMPCEGEDTEICGGSGIDSSVYASPPVVRGLSIKDPGLIQQHNETSLVVNMTSGTFVQYDLEVQDGSDITTGVAPPTSPLLHNFRATGKYAVVLDTTDAESNKAMTVKSVHVQSEIKEVNLTCPEAVPINTKFECFLIITDGTELQASIHFDSGQAAYPIQPSDAYSYHIGSATAVSFSTGDTSTPQGFIMFNQVIKTDATVAAWEFNAKTAGDVRFQIFRPTCDAGKMFCFKAYSCIPENDVCKKQSSKWAKRCNSAGSDYIYSLARQNCVHKTTGQVSPQVFLDSMDQYVIDSFELVHEVQVTLGDTGPGYITDRAFFAQAGDLMGYRRVSGSLNYEDEVSCYETYLQSVAVGEKVPYSGGAGCSSSRHLLRAHLIQPSRLRYTHNYTEVLKIYNMRVDVQNSITGMVVSDTSPVDVQEIIQSVSFNTSKIAATNDSVSFDVNPHTGNKVTYNWTFGDGGETAVTENQISYTFKEAGIYSVFLLIWNKVSSANWTETIIIQDRIEDLKLVTRSVLPQHATVFGTVTWLDFSISQGTNVTYDLSISDGDNFTFVHDEPLALDPSDAAHNGLSGFLSHYFQEPGLYTCNITVTNLINSLNVSLDLPVQIPLENLTIIQPKPIPFGELGSITITLANGTHAEFTSTFAGSETQNFTMSDETGIGIIYLDASDCPTIGDYQVIVNASNLVTGTLTDKASIYVDYNLTDVKIAVDRPFVDTGDPVTFNITMKWGSRYTINITWDDGEELDVYHAVTLASDGDYILYEHPYLTPSIYGPVYRFTNIFGSFEMKFSIVVQNPVLDMVLDVPTPIPFYNDSGCSSSSIITFLGTVPDPTDPYILVDYGDGYNATGLLVIAQDSPNYTYHSYATYGTYNLTLNISNFVSFLYFEKTVDVDQPITNVEVLAEPEHIKTHSETTVSVTMSWGSRVSLSWDLKDGNTVTTFAENYTDTMMAQNTYHHPGIYAVSVTCENTLGSLETLAVSPVIVQNPVVDIHLTCTKKSLLQASKGFKENVACDLWLNSGTPEPTDAELEADWGDGQTSGLVSIPAGQGIVDKTLNTWIHYWSFRHEDGYTTGDQYYIQLNVANLVSNVSLNFTVDVYEEITGLTKNVYGFDNATGNLSTGFGPLSNYYIMEEMIHFKTSFERGSHVTYNWDFDDGVTKTVYDFPDIIYEYNSPGTYTVRLNASNPLNYDFLERMIVVQRQVSGLELWTQHPRPKNRTYDFYLDIGNIGTDACYMVDYGDENATFHFHFLGNETECQRSFPIEWNDPESRTEFIPLNVPELEALDVPNVTFSNHLMKIGILNVRVTGTNIVSREEIVYPVVVTKGPCFNPLVDLESPNACAKGSTCYEETGDQIKSFYKSDIVFVDSKVIFDCEATNIAHFTWSVYQMGDNGEETPVNLNDTKLYSTGLRKLRVNPMILPYGLVKFYLNVSMDDVIGVETATSVLLMILPTPLQGEIAGGPSTPKKWNTNVTVDAETYTFDPDIGMYDWTGMHWIFYCRRICESWPKFSDDYKTIIDPTFTTQCTYAETSNHDRGCFRFDLLDGPGAVNESHIIGGKANIDTYQVYENDEIEFLVVAWKDNRHVIMNQTIHVIDGDPPDIHIVCVTNCANKVNPNGRLSMESKIKGWRRGMEFQYWWEFYAIPIPAENGMDFYKVPEDDWKDLVSTGIRSDNLAIDIALLSSLKIKDMIYRLKVIALRKGSSEQNIGWGTKEFIINEPPVAGKCEVVPNVGYALDTMFDINCAKDFEDSEGSLTYDVAYRKNVSGDAISFYSGPSFALDRLVNLPAGLSSRNHTLDVFLTVTDPIGSSTVLILNAIVHPPAVEEVNSLLDRLTSDPEEFKTSLAQSSSPEAAQLVMIYSEVMNDQVTVVEVEESNVTVVDPNDASLSDEEAQQAAQEQYEREIAQQMAQDAKQKQLEEQREQLCKGLENVEQTDLVAVKQTMQAIQAVASKPDQLNSEARDSILNIVMNSVATIGMESSNGITMADDLENTASGVITSLDLVMSSVAVKTQPQSVTSVSSEFEVEKTPEQEQYEEQKQKEQEEEKERSRSQIKELHAALSDLSTIIQKGKVAGESPTILPKTSAAGLHMVVDKSFKRDSSGRKIQVGTSESNMVTLPTTESMVGPENDTTYFFQTSVVYYTNNIYAFNNQSEVSQATSILEIAIMNDTNQEVPLKNISDIFEMKLDNRDKVLPDPIRGEAVQVDEDPEVHIINVPPHSALHLNVKRYINESEASTNGSADVKVVDTKGDKWLILLKKGDRPTDDDFDFNCTVPLSLEDRENLVKNYRTAKKPTDVSTSAVLLTDENAASNSTTTSEPMSTESNAFSSQTAEEESQYILPDKWTCFISDVDINSDEPIDIYASVKLINMSQPEADEMSEAPSSENSDNHFYDLIIYTSRCMFWQEEKEVWLSEGVFVLPMTDHTATFCGSNHLTSFGGSFVVPMNSIDLGDSAFLKLHENPVVFATMVAIMALYLIMVIWARKMDMFDAVKAGSTPLLDNNPKDKYLYELVVFTGQRMNAGTTSKVRFILTGEQGETNPRLMWDDKRPVLQRKGVDSFIMAVPQSLGNLNHLRIWHDNSGNSKSWYFSRMQITDMQTGNKFFFICDRWLAVEEDDGMIDRIVPVAGTEELTSFNHLFWTKTQKNLTDGHIWFSIFQRPPRSRFTRVQRLTCCLSLLFSSMMANILFYRQSDGKDPNTQVYRIGPIHFTPSQIYVGLMSGLIAFPASIIIVSLFRYSAERPSKKKKPANAAQIPAKIAQEDSKNDFAVHELEKQREFLETGDVSKRLLMSPTFGAPAEVIIKGPPAPYQNRGVAYIGSNMGRPTVLHAGDNKKKNPKKKFLLPWWCVIVGYLFALATIGVAFWMTVEVAGQFGAEKSKEWLFSFMISVVESIFLSQPLKVLLMALFFSLLCKKPEVEEDERPRDLKPNEEWLHKHLTEKDMDNPETREMLKKYNQGPMTLDEEYVKAAREERHKELKMYSVIREILFYLLFLYLMMMVAYGNRDPWSVYLYQNHKNMFHHGSHYGGQLSTFTFDKIHSRDDFWNWMKHVMLPGVYSPNFYDGSYHSFMQGYTADNQGYLIGEPRLRQLRVHSEPCPHIIEYYMRRPSCSPPYGLSEQDSGDYMKGWQAPNVTAGEEADSFWTYRGFLELKTHPHWGKMDTYTGGGYVAGLGRSWQEANDTIVELMENRWLDLGTRAVFIEFLIYNPNINLFSFSQMLLEFPQTGAGYSYFKFHVMRLNRYIGTWMFVVMVSEIFTLIFIIFYMYKEIRKMIKERKQYFSSFWNVWELVTTCLCITGIVMFFYRLFIGQQMEDEIHEEPYAFHNFQYVILWDEIYNYILGLIIFMSTAKFLKLLRFNRRMSLLTSTLHYSSKSLRSYMVMFAIVFFAFVQLAYLMFYAVLLDFMSFIRSTETMFSLMLNKFDFNKMREADRVWAPVIVFLFTLFVSFILINIFITIVVEGYFKVKNDISMQSNEYEIVDFIMNRFKAYMGIGQAKRSKKLKNIVNKKLEFDPDEYIEGVDPNAATAEDLRTRVVTMLEKLEVYIAFKSEDKAIMKEMEKLKQKPPKRIFVAS